jgi:catechol 2,3-dioxygenase-like lactoylglutathione lyase family enzyme
MTSREAPGVDREIYPMPMFVTLPVRDLRRSTVWYEAAGFAVLATMPGPAGPASLVHLRRLRFQDLLLVPGEPVPGPRITFTAGEDDLEARAQLLAAELALSAHHDPNGKDAPDAGLRRVAGPSDTAWFTRDLVLNDPDGYTIVLTAPRTTDAPMDEDWRSTVEQSVGRRP